jgi:teichuronic acid biosynthesis protein TuaE
MHKLYLISSLLGYAAGFSSLWLMHLLMPIYVFISFIQSLKLKQLYVKKTHLIFIAFLLFSVAQSSDLVLALKYLFYYTCGAVAFLCGRKYANKQGLKKYLNILLTFVLLNMIIGLLENFGIFRLPFSPFSPYVGLLGHDGAVLEVASEQKLSKATGFFWNPNNFAFVVVIFSPIFLLAPKTSTKYLSFSAIVILLTYSQSRACSVAFILILPFIIYFNFFHKKNTVFGLVLIILSVIIITLGGDWLFRKLDFITGFLQAIPMYIDLAISGVEQGASVFTRLKMYSLIWSELMDSPLLGLGLGGAEAVLLSNDMYITKPHNFILMFIADFGLLFSIYWFVVVLLTLFRIWHNAALPKYLRRGLILSSVAFVPASFSPSIIIYMMMFWLYLAMFSLAAEWTEDNSF